MIHSGRKEVRLVTLLTSTIVFGGDARENLPTGDGDNEAHWTLGTATIRLGPLPTSARTMAGRDGGDIRGCWSERDSRAERPNGAS